MKSITKNSESIRNINGGTLGIDILLGLGSIYGAYEACKGAWDLGQWLGKKIMGK